jgi:Tfp pilus assembly protein PilE
MIIKKKVPAFTLMEVTISMLIAAIAIAITYTAYRIVNGTYINYTRKQDRIAAFTVADKLLKKDFLQADQIIRSADGLDLRSENGFVRYQFKEEYILREQSALQTDTFKLPVKSVLFSFENQAIAEGDTVDQLSLETLVENENVPLIYHKIYSAQNLFK